MRLKKSLGLFRISFLMTALVLAGCSSIERIDSINDKTEKDSTTSKKYLKEIQNGNVVRELPAQWINTTPVNSSKNTISNERNLPPCAISMNRPSSVSLADISAFIGRVCGVPIVITPDVQQLSAGASSGSTQKVQGALPLPSPDESGMMPLAQMGATAGVSTLAPAVSGGTILKGVYWQGVQLDRVMDEITTRLGLSWRVENGRAAIFWLDTRTYPVMFMDSKAGFGSKTVSGTTTSGSSGASGGGISGDANTSQTTEIAIKSDLYADVGATIKSMLTPNVGRMHLSAGVLTVTDTPRVLGDIGRYMDERNKELNRQVVLNVQVYSVETKNQDQLGIDWKAVFTSGSVGLSLGNAFTAAEAAALSGGVSILDGKGKGTDALIRALSEQANISVVTNASSLTTNMNSVPIQVALQQDYISAVSTEATANVGSTTTSTKSTITTGFNMTVLPFLMPNSPQMQLQFSINMSDDPTRRTVKQGDNSQIELMETRLKTFTQRVNIKSGQTLVLSGYEQMNNTASYQGVGSSRFYGLGGGRNGEKNNTQLVILITPVILG
ncbi:TPA: PilN family type IVB pilus formation outer membrane protein [Yersinia enterocolitica]|nr:PilN family type IVB pilus formation outer membrane protein [Yersinia enterocolitica]